jgi:hypothetical protein
MMAQCLVGFTPQSLLVNSSFLRVGRRDKLAFFVDISLYRVKNFVFN